MFHPRCQQLLQWCFGPFTMDESVCFYVGDGRDPSQEVLAVWDNIEQLQHTQMWKNSEIFPLDIEITRKKCLGIQLEFIVPYPKRPPFLVNFLDFDTILFSLDDPWGFESSFMSPGTGNRVLMKPKMLGDLTKTTRTAMSYHCKLQLSTSHICMVWWWIDNKWCICILILCTDTYYITYTCMFCRSMYTFWVHTHTHYAYTQSRLTIKDGKFSFARYIYGIHIYSCMTILAKSLDAHDFGT